MAHSKSGIIAAAILGVALAATGPARADETCTLRKIAGVKARLDNGNKVLIAAKLGEAPVWFQLDTGAEFSIIRRAVADRLGIPVRDTPNHVYSAAGKDVSDQARVPSLTLGEAVSRDEVFWVYPGGSDGTDDYPVGLFGADYMQNYDVEIDLAGGMVNLFSQDHCKGKVVYWAKEYFALPIHVDREGRITLAAELDGEDLTALLDTGAWSSALEQSVAAHRMGITTDSPNMVRAGTAGDGQGNTLPFWKFPFKTLKLNGVTIHNPDIAVAAIIGTRNIGMGVHMKDVLPYDMLLGMNLLSKFHLYIAYREEMIYYTLATAPPSGSIGSEAAAK